MGFTARADVAARRAIVLARRIEQVPYAEIGAELGIPAVTARSDYLRALEQNRAEQAEAAALTVTLELAKLDVAERAAWKVLRTRHITVQHGKIVGRVTGLMTDPETRELVRDEDGKAIPVIEEVEDDTPTLQAIDRILKIAERRSRLLGLDAPVRSKIEVTDALDAEIERLVAEVAGLATRSEAEAPGAPGR